MNQYHLSACPVRFVRVVNEQRMRNTKITQQTKSSVRLCCGVALAWYSYAYKVSLTLIRRFENCFSGDCVAKLGEILESGWVAE